MATVGLVGGLGPESTIDYYRRLLAGWKTHDPASAPSIVIDSLDVQQALRLVHEDRPALTAYLLASVRRLAGAGVDFVAMTANTAHIVFDEVAAQSPVPLISIVEVCALEARREGLDRLALLGYAGYSPWMRRSISRCAPVTGSPCSCPRRRSGPGFDDAATSASCSTANSVMKRGSGSRRIVGALREDQGIDGVILGGTELPLLLPGAALAGVPALDTTALHVTAILERLRSADDGRGSQ